MGPPIFATSFSGFARLVDLAYFDGSSECDVPCSDLRPLLPVFVPPPRRPGKPEGPEGPELPEAGETDIGNGTTRSFYACEREILMIL